MKNKILLVSFYSLLAGCASWKYPNWEYVRVETEVPNKNCVYKMQESCSEDGNQCMEWHKKRATNYGANTVVITDKSKQNQFSAGMFGANGGENMNTLADYYYCNSAKNITPPK
jgi:hypothetical protein